MTQVTEIDCGNDLVHTFVGDFGVMANENYITVGSFGGENRYFFPRIYVKEVRIFHRPDEEDHGEVTTKTILEFRTEKSIGQECNHN